MKIEKLTEERKDAILNALIDHICDYGDEVMEAIETLLDLGVTKEELLALNFEEDDVDMVLEDKEFD